MKTVARLAVISLLAILAQPAVTSAQGGYFGQNKVQYKNFDFKVLKTDHFDIYYYPEEEAAAKMASRLAERWYGRLSQLLTHELRGRQAVILYASGPHFRQTNVVEGELGEGTGGVTEAYKRRIILPFAGPLESTDHVLGHELVHAFQYDITGTNVNANSAGALALPLWFIEGMAEYLSLGPVDPHTAMWMRESARREKLPSIKNLDDPNFFPYRYGQALWAFIGGKYGDRAIGSLLRAGAVAKDYDEAFKAVLGVDSKELSKLWNDAEFAAYRPIAEKTQMPQAFARGVLQKGASGGELNVSPELSPDGTRVMFFTEKDLFSVDLYMADAVSGKILRKITNTATDPHFESLQFLGSAGAWDPTGKRFMFPGISKGDPVLSIVNVDTGKQEREIRVKELDEILNPTWSPDGQHVAFSGLVGGLNDLFVYDLSNDSLKRLTNDAFAELEPAWSPDGKQLAFATDRFTTNLTDLQAGRLRIAIMDVATGDVRDAAGFRDAKNISPQWTKDGRSLFFLSDRQGITNVYRVSLDGGEPTQLTNLLTGVSGITSLSPAMSAAAGRVVFSAYEEDGYNVYALDTDALTSGTALVDLPQYAGILPPRTKPEGPVVAALSNPTQSLPPATAEPPTDNYKPKLQLDFAGQPSVGVGVDPFGAYASGGVSFLFSDVLGNHQLATSAQVTSRFDEIGGSVFYLNRTHRWNWGAALSQIPYVSRGFATGIASTPQGDVYVEQEYRVLQRESAAQRVISYPFSRAQRIEVSGGFQQIGLKQDVTTRTYSLQTGQQLTEDKTDLANFETLNLGTASGALVYDTSIFGATSPIRGNRYRLELSQSSGSLLYTGVLVDGRTYYMPKRPFTVALRGLVYGRFGSDGESPRLPIMYLGYSGLVRGYDPNSFDAGECGVSADGSCPAIDRLAGSRVAVGNAELRFPLLGLFNQGKSYYGKLPIEMALFADAGVAWLQSTSPNDWVKSLGVAARMNLFGFAIGEVAYVKPLDRNHGWLWQFALRPGF